MAKKIVFEHISNLKNPKIEEFGIADKNSVVKGQIIVLSNDYNAVIFQMWTKKDHFDQAVADFDFIERNFAVPKVDLRK